MKNRKVSIIIPVYNVEKYINKCISSIVNQDYYNIEIILINDGSTDNSKNICEEWLKKDKRIKIFNKKNGGVASARNIGIKEATGEYITFIDSDDYPEKEYVTYLVKLLENNNADISVTSSSFDNFNMRQSKKEKINIYYNDEALEALLLYKIPVTPYSKLFKKSIIKDCLFEENISIGEDIIFNSMVFKNAKKVVSGNKKIYFYRRDNELSLTTKFSINKRKECLKALDIIGDNINLKNDTIKEAYTFAKWRTYTDAFDNIVLCKAEKDYPEFYNKCYKFIKTNTKKALKTKTSKKQKIRGILILINPRIIPMIMKLRKRLHKI